MQLTAPRQIAIVSCSSGAPHLPLLLPSLVVMLWRLASGYSSSAVCGWHIAFAVASLSVFLLQRRGSDGERLSSSSQGGFGAGFGVKVHKKFDDSLFETSSADAAGSSACCAALHTRPAVSPARSRRRETSAAIVYRRIGCGGGATPCVS